MTDVIVYQMGKVASTAICDALRIAEINAVHSHFLGEENLARMLKNLLRPDLEEYFVHHGTGQLVQNIETTRKVKWYRKYKEKEGKKLKVITLARDPMNWYRANFTQNFEGYYGALKDWVNENHRGECGEKDLVWYLRTFHVDLFNHFTAIKSQPGSAEFQSEVTALKTSSKTRPTRPGEALDRLPSRSFPEVSQQSGKSSARADFRDPPGSGPAMTGGSGISARSQDHASERAVAESEIKLSEILVNHLNILNRPFIWFDRFFAPIFNVDIFKEEFDVEQGYRHFTNDFCDILLIRFEDVDEVHGVIGDFVGIDGFSLQKVNTSDSKPYGSEVFQAFANLNDQTAAIDKVYNSKYCRYFGYTPDFRIRNSGQ